MKSEKKYKIISVISLILVIITLWMNFNIIDDLVTLEKKYNELEQDYSEYVVSQTKINSSILDVIYYMNH